MEPSGSLFGVRFSGQDTGGLRTVPASSALLPQGAAGVDGQATRGEATCAWHTLQEYLIHHAINNVGASFIQTVIKKHDHTIVDHNQLDDPLPFRIIYTNNVLISSVILSNDV